MKLTVRFAKTTNDEAGWISSIETDQFGDAKLNAPEIESALLYGRWIGVCAAWRNRAIGYAFYTIEHDHLAIRRIAVDRNWQRQGVAASIVVRIKRLASVHEKRRVVAIVPDRCLKAQLMLKSQGFLAISCASETVTMEWSHRDADDGR